MMDIETDRLRLIALIKEFQKKWIEEAKQEFEALHTVNNKLISGNFIFPSNYNDTSKMEPKCIIDVNSEKMFSIVFVSDKYLFRYDVLDDELDTMADRIIMFLKTNPAEGAYHTKDILTNGNIIYKHPTIKVPVDVVFSEKESLLYVTKKHEEGGFIAWIIDGKILAYESNYNNVPPITLYVYRNKKEFIEI